MRAFRFCMLLLYLVLAGLSAHCAQAEQAAENSVPADLYLQGYRAWQEGESLQKSGHRAEAQKNYRIAAEKIADVQKRFPEWHPNVVEYRLKIIRQRLAEFRGPLLNPMPDTSTEPPALPMVPPSPPIPPMPTIKPKPEFFSQPMVPFLFNGETYYKMLLSREKSAPALAPGETPR